MKRRAFTLILLLVAAAALCAQSSDAKSLRKEVDALKQDVRALRQEVAELKKLLAESKPAPDAATVTLESAPFLGDRNARAAIVDFSDYQCPFCARHFSQTLPQILAEYVKTGRARYYFRDFPLDSIHPAASKAAEAAHCGGEQGKYWEMHDQLFQNFRALGREELPRYAQAAGLDSLRFHRCLESGQQAAKVRQSLAEGQKLGVQGTPAFFLGFVEPDGKVLKVVTTLSGAQPYPAFKEALDQLLEKSR